MVIESVMAAAMLGIVGISIVFAVVWTVYEGLRLHKEVAANEVVQSQAPQAVPSDSFSTQPSLVATTNPLLIGVFNAGSAVKSLFS